MKITCLLFSVYREKLGVNRLQAEALPGETAGAFFERFLNERLPAEKGLLPSTLLAVGEQYVEASYALQEGDELAFIPPVAGG